MIDVARVSALAIFLVLFLLTILIQFEWKFAAIAFPLLIGWYMSIRARLSQSKAYLRNPVYVFAAAYSLLYAPVMATLGFVLGDAWIEALSEQDDLYLIPLAAITPLFIIHSAWTAARELVVAESRTAADRAVRWERTWRPFLELFFWPLGIWFVQKRISNAAA